MLYSYEDSLLDEGGAEEFPGFSYNINEAAFIGMADITHKPDQERKEEKNRKHAKRVQNMEWKGEKNYPERTFKRIAGEKSDFLSRHREQDCDGDDGEWYYPKSIKFEKPTITGLYDPNEIKKNPYRPNICSNTRFNYGPHAQY